MVRPLGGGLFAIFKCHFVTFAAVYRTFFGEQGPPLQVSKWAFPSISLTGFWNLLKLATLRQ
jgi:hypothetical protein